mmetsp:Transcript_929/g.1672  ORF Transcript_929/g.1672 Transcript_929/m.1672 type:complete len:143 (-) Transcript_929:305-733(-)
MGGPSPVPMLAEFEPLDWERESAGMEWQRSWLRICGCSCTIWSWSARSRLWWGRETQRDQTMRRDAALHPHPPSVWGGWGTALKLESSELKLGMPSEATEGLLPCPAFPPITVWYLAEGLKCRRRAAPGGPNTFGGACEIWS